MKKILFLSAVLDGMHHFIRTEAGESGLCRE